MLAEIVWNPGTISAAGTFAVPIVAVIAVCWYLLGKAKSNNDLKARMVERGMSAEEIERVMAARGPREK